MPTFPQYGNALLVTGTNFTAQTVAYTAKSGDFVIANTVTTGAFTVTLPPVAQGGPVGVRNVSGTSAVTVKTADGSTIDGVVGTTGIGYTTIHSGATFASDGSNWYVVGS
jgi:hypothetical protein